MKITNIYENWGSIINFQTPTDFFNFDPEFWRKLIYERKLIVFKKMNFSKKDYIKFCLNFGEIWDKEEYLFNKEVVEDVEIDKGTFAISPFSNKLTDIAGRMGEMPYHADIASPRHERQQFCFRTLWITKNPNPKISGFTTWLEIEDAISKLNQEYKDLLDRTKIIQQSWLYTGNLVKEYDFVKTHPITGKKSLRLNWHNNEKFKNAYIVGVKINDQLQEDCSLVKNYIEYLEKFPDLIYEHVWDTFDIALYDNWSFIHKRSKLNFNSNLERHFYRANINHLNESEWEFHKEKYLC